MAPRRIRIRTAAEMRLARRIGIAMVVVAALAGGSGAGYAADPPKQGADPPVDEGLLEFLGSGDPSTDSTAPDDGSWMAYLRQLNLGKAARASRAPAQPKPASAAADGDKPSG
jgi:hypothetical protein